MTTTPLPWGTDLPLVGRRRELSTLQRALTDAVDGRGHCLLLTGEPGVGKSRLLAALAARAREQGLVVASGSAFAAEANVPYAAIADALARPLRALDAGTLTVLARGSEADLRAVIPGLAGTSGGSRDTSDGTAHLLWNVTQFLTRLAARTPLLLLLDNLHESDASSLELLHFLARQLAGTRILLVLAYPEVGPEHTPALQGMVRSLATSRGVTTLTLEPLSRDELVELLQRTFALEASAAVDPADRLWSHTRGNPFFIDESLKALAASGRIRQGSEGWLVEPAAPGTLPPSVREAVLARLERLDPAARRVTEIAALVEARASLPLLGHVAAVDDAALADAIDLLTSRRILVEHRDEPEATYEFAHPIIRSTVRSTLTAARERVLHAAIAAALEALHGHAAIRHAGELARHLVLGGDLRRDRRTLTYLAAAGRDAKARRADREAARWLAEALAVADEMGDDAHLPTLLEDLAAVHVRLGDGDAATTLWHRALQLAESRGDDPTRAHLLLRLAQEAARAGQARRGLALLDDAQLVAAGAGERELVVRIAVARAKMQQAIGRHDEATASVHAALGEATAIGNPALLARVHQAALQLYAWTGPASIAREHGAQALTLATAAEDREVAWSAHWAMAMLEGFTGDVDGVARHARAASDIANALASPALQAITAEIEIEHASGTGHWDEALAIAERTIPVARAILPHALLPRLLVWTGMVLLERDQASQAEAAFVEAWQRAGADQADLSETAIDNVHNVILAHTGMGMLALSRGEWREALRLGERGVALADRYRYVAWAIHRLLPMMIEACLRLEDYARVGELTARLRTQSLDLGHRLGLAWATAADALVARLRDQQADAAARLLAAADELEAVPFVFHAARMRRNAAQVLVLDGDAEGAARELRTAHEVLSRLGAELELRGVRQQMRALGLRPPPRISTSGAADLTPRELEIARMVARRLTNKEIGAALDISSRTVSTHLSNIFGKLGVDSRGALADLLREHPLLGAA